MAFSDPTKFDHDGRDGPGGGPPGGLRGRKMAKGDVTVDGGSASDVLDPNDPAVTGIPRDERHDSVDPHTGTLTDEAVQLRRERQTGEDAAAEG